MTSLTKASGLSKSTGPSDEAQLSAGSACRVPATRGTVRKILFRSTPGTRPDAGDVTCRHPDSGQECGIDSTEIQTALSPVCDNGLGHRAPAPLDLVSNVAFDFVATGAHCRAQRRVNRRRCHTKRLLQRLHRPPCDSQNGAP